MHKRELEQNLSDISARLRALGDLNVLVQKSQDLPNLVDDIQAEREKLEELLSEIPQKKEELSEITSNIEKTSEEISNHEKKFSEVVSKIDNAQGKVSELIKQTEVQLGIAANAKLASTFEQVKDDLIKDKWKWFNWLLVAVGALIIGTAILVFWQIKTIGTLYHLTFLIKLALTSPFVYFVVFINREYGRTRNLIEEYTFKAAIARSFEAYKEIIQGADSDDATKTLDFVIKSINDLYSSPMVNIKKNSIKEKENSPDILSKARALVEEVSNEK